METPTSVRFVPAPADWHTCADLIWYAPRVTESVFQALLHLRRTLSPGDLFMLVERISAPTGPVRPAVAGAPSSSSSSAAAGSPSAVKRGQDALRLLEVFAREMGEMQLLHDYWYQDDRRVEMALESLKESGLEKVRDGASSRSVAQSLEEMRD